MKAFPLVSLFLFAAVAQPASNFVLVAHSGAGDYTKMTPPVIAARRDGMLKAIHARYAILARGGAGLDQAANDVVMKELVEQHGDGGVIALDRQGHVATPFNTTGMMTGVVRGDGQIKISGLPAK
jgi:L-asparaginase / beta-aspartyl-peptidase